MTGDERERAWFIAEWKREHGHPPPASLTALVVVSKRLERHAYGEPARPPLRLIHGGCASG